MNTNDIDQLVKVIGSQGLGFFALYIVYHYLGQLFSAIIILKVVSEIIKRVDNWILGWFEIKKTERGIKMIKGCVVKIKDTYPQYPSLRGRYGVIKDKDLHFDNEAEVEILKNYEKDSTKGEREGTYLINKDFLEFIS